MFSTNVTHFLKKESKKTKLHISLQRAESSLLSERTQTAVVAHVYVVGIRTRPSTQSETQKSNMQIQEPTLFQFILLALATYRLARLFTIDVIFESLREAIWKRKGPETLTGYLFTCVWCMSIWFGSLLTIWYTIDSATVVIFSIPFALSAVAGIITARVD